MPVATFAEVAAAVRASQGIPAGQCIDAATLLEDDLGITGDDGCALLEELESTFGIAFAGADGTLRAAFCLAPDEYLFHGEGWRLFRKDKVRPLTMDELHRVIAALQLSGPA